jgi:hypothetical protein
MWRLPAIQARYQQPSEEQEYDRSSSMGRLTKSSNSKSAPSMHHNPEMPPSENGFIQTSVHLCGRQVRYVEATSTQETDRYDEIGAEDSDCSKAK